MSKNNLHCKYFGMSEEDFSECRAFALALQEKGERVRVSHVWNHSYHDSAYYLAVRWGKRVRKPQTVAHLLEDTSPEKRLSLLKRRVNLWELSRHAD